MIMKTLDLWDNDEALLTADPDPLATINVHLGNASSPRARTAAGELLTITDTLGSVTYDTTDATKIASGEANVVSAHAMQFRATFNSVYKKTGGRDLYDPKRAEFESAAKDAIMRLKVGGGAGECGRLQRARGGLRPRLCRRTTLRGDAILRANRNAARRYVCAHTRLTQRCAYARRDGGRVGGCACDRRSDTNATMRVDGGHTGRTTRGKCHGSCSDGECVALDGCARC